LEGFLQGFNLNLPLSKVLVNLYAGTLVLDNPEQGAASFTISLLAAVACEASH
jgi:C4-dicarboxylate-specific signal transduction histidine kinase